MKEVKMMIKVLSHPEGRSAADIVTSALIRSFTSSQVSQSDYQDLNGLPKAAVLISPRTSEVTLLQKLASNGSKILVLGNLCSGIAKEIGMISHPDKRVFFDDISVDPNEPFNVTSARIKYDARHVLGAASVLRTRHLCRFDFTNEWNNLGYGKITSNGDIWSICNVATTDGATAIAWIEDQDKTDVTIYAAVLDTSEFSVLWYNRCVGPVDSLEWAVIERFFGDYRHGNLSCFPYLAEVPFGYKGVITMRLDCDQAVSSARSLFDLYKGFKFPFSLAVMTGLKMDQSDRAFLDEVIESGGSLVSHSHHHPPNWGGTYEAAINEALISKKWLEQNTRAGQIKYAISPFHQNPPFALEALADAGYKAFVGGIIHNDPEFLLGRAGQVPILKKPLVSLSQQCMLHGDCYHRYGNAIDVYKESFDNHMASGSIFGYLDHPFSKEYTYGWRDEEERLAAHKNLLEYILSFENTWRCSINQCLDFLIMRNSAQIHVVGEKIKVIYNKIENLPSLCVKWRGAFFEA